MENVRSFFKYFFSSCRPKGSQEGKEISMVEFRKNKEKKKKSGAEKGKGMKNVKQS